MLALLVAQQLAEAGVDHVAAQRGLVGRDQTVLEREQLAQGVGVAAFPRLRGHGQREQCAAGEQAAPAQRHSAPVSNALGEAGRPSSTRTAASCPPSAAPISAAGVRCSRSGELRERLEVGAHLTLLEVVGEAQGVALGVASRGKMRAYSEAGRPRRRVAAQVADDRSRMRACSRSCSRIARP